MTAAIIVSYMVVLNRMVVASLDVGGNCASRNGPEDVLVIH
jgi:hypothetical protein